MKLLTVFENDNVILHYSIKNITLLLSSRLKMYNRKNCCKSKITMVQEYQSCALLVHCGFEDIIQTSYLLLCTDELKQQTADPVKAIVK